MRVKRIAPSSYIVRIPVKAEVLVQVRDVPSAELIEALYELCRRELLGDDHRLQFILSIWSKDETQQRVCSGCRMRPNVYTVDSDNAAEPYIIGSLRVVEVDNEYTKIKVDQASESQAAGS